MSILPLVRAKLFGSVESTTCAECRTRGEWWAMTGNLMIAALLAALYRYFDQPDVRVLLLALLGIELARRFEQKTPAA